MAKVLTVFKTLRNHWKKSTLGICLVTGGGYWLYGKHCDNILRRAACQEAKQFGDQLIPATVQAKKVTVFLNPAASKGKARSLFEKNAAPILHLAGLEVKVVKTDYEGQAKKLLGLMEDTDMIIVAGGDGTLQEVITGLLRRADEATFSKIPIGFVPLGTSNTLSHTLYPENKEKVKHITDAVLAILKGEKVSLDVLQIKSEKEQPVFAVTGLRWGSYTDATAKASKYWYLGPLKNKASLFFSTLKEWPQRHQAALMIAGPTEKPPVEDEARPPRPPIYQRIYQRLLHYWAPPKKEVPQLVVPEPWSECEVSAVEMSVSTQNSQPDPKQTKDFMTICIDPDNLSKGDFISRGALKMSTTNLCSKDSQVLQASECRLQLPEVLPEDFPF
ncbi:acylglycerol kinase, mitochondrial isoform X2 [Latimeria chalumnae]|uniref:acylglycerol kinase, mitochondrial isoform X2 n=1 Tax=Latimeria chalumnae TaxID=7897 RepID=UPI00313A9AF0